MPILKPKVSIDILTSVQFHSFVQSHPPPGL